LKLIKSSDEKARLRAEAEKKKQQVIIDAVTAKEIKRKQEIDANESKYASEMQMFQIRCQNRGANAPALIRLSLLIHERDIRRFSPGEWDALISSYGLTKFATMINELCPPEKPPVKKTIPDLTDD